MTKDDFRKLPNLLLRHHVIALGYGRAQLEKFVACGVVLRVELAGMGQHRYQKKQFAELLKWEELLETAAFAQEPPTLTVKATQRWTGLSDTTLANIAAAGGLTFVKPPGAGNGKYLKQEIGRIIGYDRWV